MSRTAELAKLGQSVWIDYISRQLLTSGDLQKLIDEDGLRGMTSNPTIFEKAIDAGKEYQEPIERLVGEGKSAEEIYDEIVFKDIGDAADILRSVYDRTGGNDGFVSIEVFPALAYDTVGTIREAKRLFLLLARPNIMVKIPGTREGIPAIMESIAEEVNVNITLLFSIENYKQVMEAYLQGLETRVKQNLPIDKISSVASFFVSRVDTIADKELQTKSDPAVKKLLGKAAVANAKLAYQEFKKVFTAPRFLELQKRGAKVQRPLWASTSTKNPVYSDILYVQELIANRSVNTMPLETLKAFNDHGDPRLTIEENPEEARNVFQELKRLGIDIDKITENLQKDGVKLFAESFEKLMKSISAKREAVAKH